MEDTKDMIVGKIMTSEITETDLKKIRKDLRFIGLMTKLAKGKDCRLIVSGGYAVDGNLVELLGHTVISISKYMGKVAKANKL